MTSGVSPVDPVLDDLLGEIAERAGAILLAAIQFGSHVSGASPGPMSAYDLLLVVTSYRGLYARVHREIGAPLSPWLLAALNRILPPNVVHWRSGDGALEEVSTRGPSGALTHAKLFVITEEDLTHAIRRGRDHFLRGRLTQHVRIVYAKAPEVESRVGSLIDENRRTTLSWVLPFLKEPFGVEKFSSRMLEVSYRGEIRPESPDRIREVFEAQRGFFLEVYSPLLEAALKTGLLAREGEGYRACAATSSTRSLQVHAYFLVSKVRATLRWLKYLVTFEGWAPYLVAKIERRKGISVEISERERRWPLLFLWPKLLRVIRARDPGGNRLRPSGEQPRP